MIAEEIERSAFERWAKEYFGIDPMKELMRTGGPYYTYVDHYVQIGWSAWKAARGQ